jgi:hypothetical protein
MNPEMPDDVEIGYSSSRIGITICRFISLLFSAALLIGRFGIRDLGVAHQFIVWDSTAAISVREYRRRKFVALNITPSQWIARCA